MFGCGCFPSSWSSARTEWVCAQAPSSASSIHQTQHNSSCLAYTYINIHTYIHTYTNIHTYKYARIATGRQTLSASFAQMALSCSATFASSSVRPSNKIAKCQSQRSKVTYRQASNIANTRSQPRKLFNESSEKERRPCAWVGNPGLIKARVWCWRGVWCPTRILENVLVQPLCRLFAQGALWIRFHGLFQRAAQADLAASRLATSRNLSSLAYIIIYIIYI